MTQDSEFSRFVWMSRSVRLPSPRRLQVYAEMTRQDYAARGLNAMLIASGPYRLHILEGPQGEVQAAFDRMRAQASGVGIRLLQARPAHQPACDRALTYLPLHEAAWTAQALSELFARAGLPGDVPWQQVRTFLCRCIDHYTIRRAA